MQLSIFTVILPSLVAFASAAPSEKRQISSVSITFYTPDGEKWSQTFPTDMTSHQVGMLISTLQSTQESS